MPGRKTEGVNESLASSTGGEKEREGGIVGIHEDDERGYSHASAPT